MRERIKERLLAYEQALRGGVALYSASDEVTSNEWQQFVKDSQLQSFFPGINTIGVISNAQPDGTQSALLGESDKDRTAGEKNSRCIIRIAPFRWQTRKYLGFDITQLKGCSEAMDRAAKTGTPSMTGLNSSTRTPGDMSTSGLYVFTPIYNKSPDVTNLSDPKAELAGWAFAALDCRSLLEGVADGCASDISFALYDSEETGPETLLFELGNAGDTSVKEPGRFSKTLLAGGRVWTLTVSSTTGVASDTTATNFMIMGLGGAFGILLAAFVLTLGRKQEHAQLIALEMTADLQTSELKTRLILDNASEAILTVSKDGTITSSNAAARFVFGLTRALIGTSFDDLLERETLAELAKSPSKTSRRELTCVRADGSTFPAKISLSQIAEVEADGSFIIVCRDETERRDAEREVAEMNVELLNSSKKAALAEVATGVLHNVGNALNSVSTSSSAISRSLKTSPANQLVKAVEIMESNKHQIAEFLQEDPRGRHCMDYLKAATKALVEQDALIGEENDRLLGCAQHIREIIRSQQAQAKANPSFQEESANDLMDQAVNLNSGRHSGYGIQLNRFYEECPPLTTDRHQVLQILTNLIANAHDAVREVPDRVPLVTVATKVTEDSIEFSVIDNGVGIAPENLSRIKTFGFTTKDDGHGFGLHSCVRAARSLGGEIQLMSDGLGHGAIFSLTLPIVPDKALAEVAAC
jgi:PAS domain S-box-containing protein